MKGIEFAEVRDAIARSFNGDEFDMFLYERLNFDRTTEVADGPFKTVVTEVLKSFERQGLEPILIAEVAAARPLKQEVQSVYRKFAQALVDEARQQVVENKLLDAVERYGLGARVTLQKGGKTLLPSAAPASDRGFERRVKQYLKFLNVGLWREQLFRLEGQVCRVEFDDKPGTGFLVGPDALLTNYHVLRDVIKKPTLASKVRLRFDYRVLGRDVKSDGTLAALATGDWLIDHSPYTAGEAANNPDKGLPTPDELDYALVRLDRAIGDETFGADSKGAPRGWIPIPTAAPPISSPMPVLILQHPGGDPLKLAFDTEAVLTVNANGTRVRYATNTEGGSSGSPCFDIDWKLIALHHYGDPTHDNAQYNQGIPIGMIRSRLAKKGKDGALGGPSSG